MLLELRDHFLALFGGHVLQFGKADDDLFDLAVAHVLQGFAGRIQAQNSQEHGRLLSPFFCEQAADKSGGLLGERDVL